MATQDKNVGGVRPGFVKRGTHRAPGVNSKHQHHPVTEIFTRRFPKSYREYA